jgi:hypothetical protein
MPRFKRSKLDVAASATGPELHPLKSSAFAAHFLASYRSKFLAVNAEKDEACRERGNRGMGEKNTLMYHAVPRSPKITLACRRE